MSDLIDFRQSFCGRHVRSHSSHSAHNLLMLGRVVPPIQLGDQDHPTDHAFQMPIGNIQHFKASRVPNGASP
jgi:hypothetical protein